MIRVLAVLLGSLWNPFASLSQSSEGGDRGQELDPDG